MNLATGHSPINRNSSNIKGFTIFREAALEGAGWNISFTVWDPRHLNLGRVGQDKVFLLGNGFATPRDITDAFTGNYHTKDVASFMMSHAYIDWSVCPFSAIYWISWGVASFSWHPASWSLVLDCGHDVFCKRSFRCCNSG